MKKKIIGVAVVAAMALTAGWNYNQSNNEMAMSDLALANVEALANREISAGCVLGGCTVSLFADCWLYHWGYPETFCPNAYGG